MKLTFLGAAGTVTGSKYLIEAGGLRILVDCGLFQGYKNLRLLNWQPMPFSTKEIDAVVLTHAHIDHSGALPLLVKQGYRGPVYATRATAELCGLLLPWLLPWLVLLLLLEPSAQRMLLHLLPSVRFPQQ